MVQALAAAGELDCDLQRELTYAGLRAAENGFQVTDTGVLAAAAAVLIAVGTWRFRERDLG
ncbi:hypothetical protein [Actinomadura macra]|uniref:hypothetical protein n=1 Tax=Actinomadura macra TaxID=46164 RepID=UPI001C3F321E|nr:hypothetical protein [Actinomadura macra]